MRDIGRYLVSGVAGVVLGVAAALTATWLQPDPVVRLPAEVVTQPGRWYQLTPETNGKEVRWHSCSDGLDLFRLQDGSALVVAPRPGRYHVLAWTARGGKPSEAARCLVTVEGPDPTPPVPPDPKPPVPPVPGGARVLIVYETAEMDRMPAVQRQILFDRRIRDYLDQHCPQDGKVRAWRMWDKDTDVRAESKEWQELMARPRASVPWLVVGGPVPYDGPLPKTVDEMMGLLKKHLE